MKKISRLEVFYNGCLEGVIRKESVGMLALYKGHVAAFEYTDTWLRKGFSISPFSLPLEKKVFIPDRDPFNGLFGVFNDSLPDGWGQLLVDRMLQKNNIQPASLSVLDRLAIVGNSGMGALSYEPSEYLSSEEVLPSDLDVLSQECARILQQEPSEQLDALFCMGASSGGARPKILTQVDGEAWLIKFPSTYDPKDIGRLEYEYSLCAKACGIRMTETKLFPSKLCSGYFGTKRFDRNPQPIHMVTASGLLETSHRLPNLDYNTLMLLTLKLAKDSTELEQLYRLMCFNVFAHNRDDHSKNFSWLCLHNKWTLAPAYDLTYSNSIGGEHATTIDGEGKQPSRTHLLSVAHKIGLKATLASQIAEEIQVQCSDVLQMAKSLHG